MKALIDADIFQHEFGDATDSEYKILSWPLVQARVQGRIDKIMEATGADEYQLYLTSDDKSNFRYDIATIKPYKGNRSGKDKPHWYTHIRNFLIDHRGAIEIQGMEADDAMAIEQYKHLSLKIHNGDKVCTWLESQNERERPFHQGTVICSRDKDLHMVPGWHYGWSAGKQKEKEMWWQDEVGGLRCFYKQLLTGDAVDNIPGLYGLGKASKHLSSLDDIFDDFLLYSRVRDQYVLRFGSYADQFLLENARLLWMLREEGQIWEAPVDV